MNDPLQSALHGLTQIIEAPQGTGTALGNWRWTVRQRLASVRECLALDNAHPRDLSLRAREGSMLRDRNELLTRLAALGPTVLESPEVEGIRHDLRRLVADIAHYRQRLHDLVYDDVEMELGGSE